MKNNEKRHLSTKSKIFALVILTFFSGLFVVIIKGEPYDITAITLVIILLEVLLVATLYSALVYITLKIINKIKSKRNI